MRLFRLIKLNGRMHFCDDIDAHVTQFVDGTVDRWFLIFLGIKDHAAILAANVIALTIQRGGIMRGKEDVEYYL